MNASRSERRNLRSRLWPTRRHGSTPAFVHRRRDVSLTLRNSAASPMSKRSLPSLIQVEGPRWEAKASPAPGSLGESPSHWEPECVLVVLERIQQFDAGELPRVVRA